MVFTKGFGYLHHMALVWMESNPVPEPSRAQGCADDH